MPLISKRFIKMSIYKLICSESKNVYYGATKHSMEYRRSKGHYRCSCKDFVNPTLELVEIVQDITKLYEREKYYIKNFECINIDGKGNKPNEEQLKKRKEKQKLYNAKIKEEQKYHCSLCNLSFHSPKKLSRHNEGYRHKLKNESFEKHGENWMDYYKIDNQNRYKKKRLTIP